MNVVRRLGALLRHAFWFEVALYVSLWRWIARRPAIPPGSTAVTYGQAVAPLMWLFTIGSAVEVVAVDLVLHQLGWTAVRIPVLVLGVWSLMWMAGLLAAIRTRPHVVTATELRLRAGPRREVVVPLSHIASVSTHEHELSSSMKSIEARADLLLVGVSGRTNLQLSLSPPIMTGAPTDAPVAQVGVWVDEPRDIAALLRRTAAIA